MNYRRYIFMILVVFAIIVPVAAFAQTPAFVPLASTGDTVLNQAYSSPTLAAYFTALFNIALSVGAMLAVLRLVYAGYLYMGSDMWSSKGKAREIIGNAVLGLLLLLAVWLILNQINPNILNLDIFQNVSALPATPQTTTSAQPTTATTPAPTVPDATDSNGLPVPGPGI